MFEPVRGGTRGGQAEFKWTDVSADKDREHYLGHSINAPTGRWQKNKDIHWYNRDASGQDQGRGEEIRKIKELEAEALSVALGFAPSNKPADNATTAMASTANRQSSAQEDETLTGDAHKGPIDEATKQLEKEEKRIRKAARMARGLEKEQRRRDREHTKKRRSLSHSRSRSRSRSPTRSRDHRRRRSSHAGHVRNRSSSPRAVRHRDFDGGYDSDDRERERERDRRRWNLNANRRGGPRDRA